MPSPGQVYVDQALTNLSIRYSNPEFIADKVFPLSPVDHCTGLYFVYDKSNLRIDNTSRRGMAHSNEVDYSTVTAPYGPLKEHSLRVGIPQAVLDQYQNPLDPRSDAAMTVMEKLMIEKELALATALSSTTNITQNTVLSGTSQFSDPANSDPFNVIQAGFDTILQNGVGIMPNTMVLGWAVWSKLRNHPDLIERVKYAAGGASIKTLKPEDLGVLFDIPNIMIGKAVYNSAPEGEAAQLSFIWGKNIQLLYVDGGTDIRTVTAGRTLTMNGSLGTFNYPDEEPGVGEWIKTAMKYQQLFVAKEAAYLIGNAVA